MSILQKINGHDDLTALDDRQRTQLCGEIREFLVSNVSKTGGHLAGNLGVVELSVAIETVFNTEIDRLVFDVGHQSYVHKLLTGRQADFRHLRQYGGLSGFPKPSESNTDASWRDMLPAPFPSLWVWRGRGRSCIRTTMWSL